MTRIEEIKRTYYLDSSSFISIGLLVGIKLQSEFKPNLTFIGVGRNFFSARRNCVEMFEIHQHLYKNGLLNHKNLN